MNSTQYPWPMTERAPLGGRSQVELTVTTWLLLIVQTLLPKSNSQLGLTGLFLLCPTGLWEPLPVLSGCS